MGLVDSLFDLESLRVNVCCLLRGVIAGSRVVARGEIMRIGPLLSAASLLASIVLKPVSVRLLEVKKLAKRFRVRQVLVQDGMLRIGSGEGLGS
jgi:hypothetical protein